MNTEGALIFIIVCGFVGMFILGFAVGWCVKAIQDLH